ncbi:OmpH family outer membrane protein [Mucilaginibacter sp. SG564]|uniref:OmpH family outer membrane protein n=1 Tax=unclassified Mucilaginibacter TaxID=2617802 RepID=UPI0015575C46|nr:OmpH family outer membrane protein [Mucilaginibacter sp. SG564]NOW96559.1 outer membrane protein [Mucilaginibacter sp. SG564]
MRKLFKVTLLALSLLFISKFSNAQSKIGYVDFQAIVSQMPEAKTIKPQIDAYQKQFVTQLTAMNNDLQTKGKAYQDQSKTMSDADKTAKQTELQDLQKKMQDYQATAQQQVEAKSNELIKPITDKARAAVNDVAKEKGITYVFDSSQGSALLVSNEGANLTASVKTKLGIK